VPLCAHNADVEVYSENLRKAVCETFVRLDNEWSNYGHLSGRSMG